MPSGPALEDAEAKFELAWHKSVPRAGRDTRLQAPTEQLSFGHTNSLEAIPSRNSWAAIRCTPTLLFITAPQRLGWGRGEGRERLRWEEGTDPASEKELTLQFLPCSLYSK